MTAAHPRSPAGSATRTLHCPAKLNLTLAVGPPRADGLHPIASTMVAVDFGDTLTITPLDKGPSRFERAFADDAPVRQAIDWPIERDLTWRAHALMQERAGRPLPIDCKVLKRIPAGAGLGGGSSNAAAVLVGVRDIFGVPIRDEHLIAMGLSLGSDIGFLVHAQLGRPAATVSGVGEIITPLPAMPPFHAAIVFPDGACPTGAVYTAFDRLGGNATGEAPEPPPGINNWPTPFNDLTAAAVEVCPAIGRGIDLLATAGITAHVTGSGSALFVVTDSPSEAEAMARRAHQMGLRAVAARGLNIEMYPLQPR